MTESVVGVAGQRMMPSQPSFVAPLENNTRRNLTNMWEEIRDCMNSIYLTKETIRYGKFSERGAASSFPNQLFMLQGETVGAKMGRNGTSWASWYTGATNGWQWMYFSGMSHGTYPVSGTWYEGASWLLGTFDEGLLFYEDDYNHLFRWNGTNFEIMTANNYIVAGIAAPMGGKWALCNGDSANVLNSDCSGVSSATTPNLCQADKEIFITGKDSADAAEVVAEATKWHASTNKTGAESAHTHALGNIGFAGDSGGPSATEPVCYDTPSHNVPTDAHLHDITHTHTGYTSAAGSSHQHTMTDANATFKPPKAGDGGVPLRWGLKWYYRL